MAFNKATSFWSDLSACSALERKGLGISVKEQKTDDGREVK